MRISSAVAALIVICAAGASAWAAPLPVRPDGTRTSWPQQHSDVPADPAILFGVLPNGMRYAIRHNNTPSGQVSLRLRIAAGSLFETPAEAGIAHFLEHMAFRGSKHLPDGAAIKTMETLGLSMGADLNAQTGASQTVFQFDLPSGSPASLDKGLMLTREIAGNLTLSPKALASERHVVLAEMHLRDTPSEHMARAELHELFGARLGAAMMPIGREKTVDAVTAARMRRFYEHWYRPDRATLIVVGAVDPKATQAQIQKQFGSWTAAGPQPMPPDYRLPQPQTPQVHLFNAHGVAPVLSINWVRPHDRSPDTMARERSDTVRMVAIQVLDQRLQILARRSNPPFISASAQWSPVDDISDITEADASYAAGHALEAVEAVHGAIAGLLVQGPRPGEISEAVKNIRAFLQMRAAAANTTPSARLAQSYVSTIGEHDVITSPQQDLQEFDAFTQGLSPPMITAELKTLFAGTPPELFVASPVPVQTTPAALAAALTAAPAVAEATHEATQPWPYTAFGAPAKIVAQHADAGLGTTFVTFGNGVRAVIKPTDFQKGQILVAARFGNGRLGMPKADGRTLWALNAALVLGGLKRITLDDMQSALAGRQVGVRLSAQDASFVLSGGTRPADFKTQLELIAAYLSDPAFRPQGFERGKLAMLNALTELNASPSGVLELNLSGFLHDGDPRFSTPDAGDVAATKLAAVKALLEPQLKDGPLEVDVVGDISVNDAIAAIAQTLGALPPRPAPQRIAGDERLPPKMTAPVVLHYRGTPGQAVALIAWPTTGMFPDPQQARTLRVLSSVLSTRLFDEVRTAQGLTYTPQTEAISSLETPDYGYLEAFASVPPSKIDAFYAAVDTTVADLRNKPISQVELERARGPMVHDLEHVRQTNNYWLSMLAGSQADPRRLSLINSVVPDTTRVTAADVQRAAQKYLHAAPYRMQVIPAQSAAGAAQ